MGNKLAKEQQQQKEEKAKHDAAVTTPSTTSAVPTPQNGKRIITIYNILS